MTHKEMINKTDLLEGCVNRICVTDDYEEIISLYASARGLLIDIVKYNSHRLNVRTSEQIERNK